MEYCEPAAGWQASKDPPDYPYASVVKAIDAAIMVFDENLELRFINEHAHALLRTLDSAGLGEKLKEVAREALATFDQPIRREFSVWQTGRNPVWIGCSATPTTCGEAMEKRRDILLMFQDITRQRLLQEERDRLLELAAIVDVLPAILHELKNPLAAVTTAVEVLLEEVSEGHTSDELHSILSEVRRMKLNLESVGLAHYQLQSSRAHVIDEAIRQTWSILSAQMELKSIRGQLELPMLPLLPLDPVAVRAVLFNLVSNAIQACRAGDCVWLRVSLQGGERLQLTVSDTGRGMAPEVLAKCRQLFFTTRTNGSGIGLALCQKVIQDACGQLDIESGPGKGTRVAVTIPVVALPATLLARSSFELQKSV
jgi:signal transduction histidine kinase